VSLLVIIICAILGFFAASIVWTLARNQSMRRPLFAPPRCETNLAVSFSRKPTETSDPASTTSQEQAACGQPLPVLAWLPLYGLGTAYRCPYCGTRQSQWRAVFEVLTALYFVIAAARIDDGLDLTAVLVFSLPLLMILLVDTWTRLIYTNVIYLGILAGLIFATLDGGVDELIDVGLAMLAAFAIFVVFFAMAKVFYRSVSVVPFGRGDIYLAVMIAAMVRFDDVIRALFLGIVLAAVGGVLLIATKQVSRRQAMPYGPYLCLGALIALIW
jgi:prepilin signal peptidase PulO-like enzyme (type II secretory pathway)